MRRTKPLGRLLGPCVTRWVLAAILLSSASGRAQSPSATPSFVADDPAVVAKRIAALEVEASGCGKSGHHNASAAATSLSAAECIALRGLIAELRSYQEELVTAAEARAAIARLDEENRKEREELDREPTDMMTEEPQKLSPAAVEELEGQVRLGTLTRDRRQDVVEQTRSALGDLRQQHEQFLTRLTAAEREVLDAAGTVQAALLEERHNTAQRRRELAGERIRLAMSSLDLEYEALATSEKLLASRSSRLRILRLSAGISTEELDRTRKRVEQTRAEVASRATQFEDQLQRIDENMENARQRLLELEPSNTDPNAVPGMSPEAAGESLTSETVAELRAQIDALEAAKALVKESSHLDEFLLVLQSDELEHQIDFNRLLRIIRTRSADARQIEHGLSRFGQRLAAIRAETHALQMTSSKLRQDIQLNSEQLRHTAIRLSTAMEAANDSAGSDVAQERVNLIQALLTHQQAVTEALDSRRNLVDEATTAANDQVRRYQDTVNLLEGYVAGALRVNASTLHQFGEWLDGAVGIVQAGIEHLPARWEEFRLSLRDEQRRSHALRAWGVVLLAFLVLVVLDLLLSRWLRPREPDSFRRKAWRHAVRRLRRPVEVAAFIAFCWRAVPEARGVFEVLGVLALIWLVRRIGLLVVQLLFGGDKKAPSLRLAPGHEAWMRTWSRWLFALWPVVLAGYGAAIWFGAPLHVRLILGLLSLITTLGFLLALLVHARTGVVRIVSVASASEKPSLPVLVYNRLLHVAYLLALVETLGIVGLWGAGYDDLARWLAVSSLGTAAILVATALGVRALHHTVRGAIADNPFWREVGLLVLHLVEAVVVIGAMLGVLVVWGVELEPLWQRIGSALDREVFQGAEGKPVTVLSLVWVVVILVVTVWVSRRSRELLHSRVFPYLSIDRGQQLSMSLVMHYSLLLIAMMIGLNMLGINLTTLRVLLGAIGLGVGFGLQTIVNNFVSGIIILFERNIRPDDVIDFGGKRVRVEEVRARCTVVTDRDNKTWLVPNVRFMNETITNWTQNGQVVRGQLEFWVAGNTDLERLRQVVQDWANSHPDLIRNSSTHLRLAEIERGIFRMSLYYFTDQNWRFGFHRSKISYGLMDLLRREGFEVPATPARVYLSTVEHNGAAPADGRRAMAEIEDPGGEDVPRVLDTARPGRPDSLAVDVPKEPRSPDGRD